MRGLPASGKSTKAQELITSMGNCVRLNKDLLRTMLHFDKFTSVNEGHTRDASIALARYYLTHDMNIIIDDTNLNPKTVESWKGIAKECNAKIEYVDMDTDADECIKRDSNRLGRVGKHVIQKMALQYRDYLKVREVIICDLDGTLCNLDHRLHFVKPEKCECPVVYETTEIKHVEGCSSNQFKKDWKSFFEGIRLDTPKKDTKSAIVSAFIDGVNIIFVSARPERYRDATIEWLSRNLGIVTNYVLIMRENNDNRVDTEVKSDIHSKYLKNLKILRVYDDRPSVIRMWREKGLEVVDCGSGVEF